MSSVQSLDRAFALLEAVSQRPKALTELSKETSLPISTVSRLLGSLEQLGGVRRDDDSGLYSIGLGIASLAASIDSEDSLGARVRPELKALTRKFGETAGLSVPTGYHMHYLDQIAADQPIQVENWKGERIPMHLVSAGLVTLASWPADVVDNYLDRSLEAPTDKSLSTPEQIRTALDEVRNAGFAWTAETLVPGLTSVAAPLINNNGELVGAIHVHGPAYRFPGDSRAKLEQAVLKSAANISATLVSS